MFEKISAKNKSFEYIPVVASGSSWHGKKGFVTDVMKELDLSEHKVYMCGPKPMIDASLMTLDSLGVQEDDINYESA